MTHNINLVPNRYQLSKAILITVLLCWLTLLGGHLSAQDETLPPDSVPKDQLLLLTLDAKGVEIYACSTNVWDGPDYVWVFIGTDATLYDAGGSKVGSLSKADSGT